MLRPLLFILAVALALVAALSLVGLEDEAAPAVRAVQPASAARPAASAPIVTEQAAREVAPADPATPDEDPPAAPERRSAFDPDLGLRDKPAFEGPLVQTFYGPDQPEFAGFQVRGPDGEWLLDGPWTAWFENGQINELGAYRQGVEHGPWEWWYADGTPMARGNWNEGRREGEWTFWQEDGSLGAVGHYVDGQGQGLWVLYHENGNLAARGVLQAGTIDGPWSIWLPDGTLDEQRSGSYSQGEKLP